MTAGTGGSFQNVGSSLGVTSAAGQPPSSSWQRSLAELAASNIQRSASTMGGASSSIGPPSAAAQALLGQRTDLSGLLSSQNTSFHGTTKPSNASHQQQQASRPNAFAPNSEYGIEQSVENHRDGILNRIIKKQQQQTEQLFEKAVQKRLDDDWKLEREWWKKELVGNRNLVDPSNSSRSSADLSAIDNGAFGGSSVRGLLMNDNTNGAANFAKSFDPQMVTDHLNIVRDIGLNPDLLHFLDKFEKLALSKFNVGGYQNAWLLLREVLPKFRSPMDGALGTLTHLCIQYQGYIRNRVKAASLKGQDISTPFQYSNGLAGSISAFVKLTTGSNASIWDALYYCLRCGDGNAAKDVFASTPAGNDDLAEYQPILNRVLNQFSRGQGNAACMFQRGIPEVHDQDLAALLDLYEKAKNMDPNNSSKIGTLALLCGQPLESVPTIEDYLLSRFWIALYDREDPTAIIMDVGENIRKWGPSHFVTEDSGAWGYCFPLICAQQFRTALSFLAEAGGGTGLLEAAHLGLIFSMAGVPVSDLGETPPIGAASRNLVTILLLKYAQMLERDNSSGLAASLQYLLRIPSKKDSHNEIAALIVRSPDHLDFLVGTMDHLFSRQNSELDKYLPPKEVASILDIAAEAFKRQSNDSSKAVLSAKLYMLAYSYPKLVEFLIQLTSPPDVFDNEKMFWNKESQIFYNTHLSRRTAVVESLERNNVMELATTLKTMLELHNFFVLRRERKFEEAFSVVAATGVLPMRQDEIDAKQYQFKDLHPMIRNALPSTLSAAVECLYEQYRHLKSESRGLTVEVEARLRELIMYARILFVYGGFVNMPTTCLNNISQMRANMV